ncbi:hypothetical protein [Salinisphaera sp. T31B1]|uniref:hypothetical protein n=1 Tax=Salinisphaera sp. T31B1 TaxID=727963 RepID=UPI00333F9A50
MLVSNPIDPPCRIEAPKVVPARHGLLWWRDSFALFHTTSGRWLIAALLLILVSAAVVSGCSLVPRVGGILSTIVLPCLAIGPAVLAHRRLHGRPFGYRPLLAGFSHRFGALLGAGLIQFALQTVGTICLMLTVGRHVPITVFAGLSVALTVAVTSAMWFQPALVFFGHQDPLSATAGSMRALALNWRALCVHIVVGTIGLAVLGVTIRLMVMVVRAVADMPSLAIPLGAIGILWFALLALATTAVLGVSIYIAFRDIFALREEASIHL